MNQNSPQVPRLCHLAGGLTVLSEPLTKATIGTGLGGPLVAEFTNPPYPQLYRAIASYGITVIGCQFFQSADEIQGLSPPDFRVYSPKNAWLVRDTWQTWRNVAHGALRTNDMAVADTAARIAFEIRAVEQRILDLCVAYTNQLRPLVIQGLIEEYKRFEDFYSGPVINCIHSLFYELAVLRDYLAEFVARNVLSITTGGGGIRTMAALRKYLKTHPIEDELYKEIVQITEEKTTPPGWLAVMSAYRNTFTHVSPIEQVSHRGFAVQSLTELRGGVKVPNLYYPLPADVLVSSRSRQSGFPYASFEEWAKASAKHKPMKESQPDALEYLHMGFIQMIGLAHEIVKRSPVTPEQIHLGPADIVGPISIGHK